MSPNVQNLLVSEDSIIQLNKNAIFVALVDDAFVSQTACISSIQKNKSQALLSDGLLLMTVIYSIIFQLG